LLPVTNDEDRRLRDEACTLSPCLHQQRHQLPLLAAGVLELVDQDMVIAALEAVPALRELVHARQQLDRALEHV